MNSTTLPAAPPTPPPTGGPVGRELAAAREQLQRQSRRARTGIWIETFGVVAILAVAYAVPTWITDRLLRLEWAFRAALLISFAVVVVRVFRRRLLRPLDVPLTDEEMALAVERRSPELSQALISSLQFDEDLRGGGSAADSPTLKAAVVRQVRERLQSIPFGRAIDTRRVRRYFGGIALFVAFFTTWGVFSPSSLGTWTLRNVLLTNHDWPRYTSLRFVGSDGPVRLPQGDPLAVRVAVDGPIPDRMTIDYVFGSGERGAEPMSLTGEREFTWTLDAVLANVTLTVQGGDALPCTQTVEVVERPHIDDLRIHVTYPDYMEREPFDVPPTEGELRLPRGAHLTIAGRAQKPLASAFLLFGSEQKVTMNVSSDWHGFEGEFAPPRSGLLSVDVIDRDSLGTGTPPKLLLRVGDDKPPVIEFRLRGIGASITAHARIPGDLKVRDDFGLRTIEASRRIIEDTGADDRRAADETEEAAGVGAPAPEVPWSSAEASFDTDLVRSALVYEAGAIVDLLKWNKIASEDAPDNPIRPGMLFSLRFAARDNFGPGEPHEGFGEVMTFRVVTRDKLVEELRRRQVEQRQELLRIVEDERTARLELQETVRPDDAGDLRGQAVARFRALARRQQSLGRQVRFVGEAYQRILWEYENNRLIEANKVRQIEALIPAPLEALAKDAFPITSRLVESFASGAPEGTRTEIVDGYSDIIRRLEAVLEQMEQAENLAALLEELRNVIKLENKAIDDVKRRVEDRESELFRSKQAPKPK